MSAPKPHSRELNSAQVILSLIHISCFQNTTFLCNSECCKGKWYFENTLAGCGYKYLGLCKNYGYCLLYTSDVPFTCEHDRDIKFIVDKADVDETNATAKVENISKVFEQVKGTSVCVYLPLFQPPSLLWFLKPVVDICRCV